MCKTTHFPLFPDSLPPPASGGKESSQLVPRWSSKKRWKEQGTNTVHTSVRTQKRVSSAMEIMKMFGRAFGGGGGGAPAAPVSKEEAADQPKGGRIQSVHGADQEGLRGQQQHLQQQQQQLQQEVPLRKKLSFQPPDEGGGGGGGGGGGERGSLRSPPVVSNGHSIFR